MQPFQILIRDWSAPIFQMQVRPLFALSPGDDSIRLEQTLEVSGLTYSDECPSTPVGGEISIVPTLNSRVLYPSFTYVALPRNRI
jgi:hypothetical protein